MRKAYFNIIFILYILYVCLGFGQEKERCESYKGIEFMKEKKDQLEQFIADSFEKLAKEEEEKIEKESSIQMPEHARESIRARLDDEIKKLEEKKAYEHLSEEDRRALELGRKILRGESGKPQNADESQAGKEPKAESSEEAPVRRKWTGRKRLKVCLVLAAVLVLVMAIGITGLGGPERVIQMLTQEVGEREVEKINSSDENLVIVEEDEEEAYQVIKKEFGIDSVRITSVPVGIKFAELSYDKVMQVAELSYEGEEQKIVLYINASFADSSLGLDLEDEMLKEYILDSGKCKILVTEYKMDGFKEKYSARFSYGGLEYFMLGQVSKEAFDEILSKLYFFN